MGDARVAAGIVSLALLAGLVWGGPRGLPAPVEAQTAATREVGLVVGFNLVGWAVDQPVEAATMGASGVTDLFQFDAARTQFDTYGVNNPTFINSLETLAGGRGTWVLADQATAWSIPDLPATEPLTVDLEAGFNLVAWFGPEGTPVGEALASLGESAVRAFGWVAAEQRFKTYDPARAFLTDFETLARGEALWLDMASARQWAQPVGA